MAQPAANGAGSIGPKQVTEAEALFADAPYGVDSMPTGPVSASFKQKQQALGCEEAIWPNVPAACYPK